MANLTPLVSSSTLWLHLHLSYLSLRASFILLSCYQISFLPNFSICVLLFFYFAFNFYREKTKYQQYASTFLPGLRCPQPPGEINSQQTLFGEGSLRVNFLVPFHFPFTYIKFRCYTNDAQLLLLITHNSTISPENRRQCLTDINVESY